MADPEEPSFQQMDTRQFKKSSLILGSLVILPFCLILLLDLLFHWKFELFLILIYLAIWLVGAISMIVIAFVEVKQIWKYYGGKVPDRRLTIISLSVLLFGFCLAALFIVFSWVNTVLLPHWSF
jgi:hypothetical protein